MDINKALSNIDFFKVTKVIIAPSAPKFSEVWMSRINEIFGEKTIFIALNGDYDVDTIDRMNYISLSKKSIIPNRLNIFIQSTRIRHNLKLIIDKLPKNTIVLCHYLTTAAFFRHIIKKNKNNRFYVYCHGHDVTWDRKIEKFPLINAHSPFYKNQVKELIGFVHLISNSLVTKKKLKEIGFRDKDISINHLSIDTDQMQPVNKNYSNSIKILYLGRLTDFKGPVETIRAFELASKNGLQGELHIVGDGAKMSECKKIAKYSKYHKRIFIHGAVDKYRAINFFQNADVFSAHNQLSTKTNQEEAFGVSIIEAMAFGLPVVTGRSGGVVETVVDGKTGILFDSGNIDAHASAFIKLSENIELRKLMGENARRRAVNLFDIKDDRVKLLRILEK